MRISSVILVFSVLFAGASHAGNLLCFGDSQTAIRPPLVQTDTYCYKMAQATGRTDINKGVGGEDTQMAMQRIQADVISQTAECVVVMFGANDGFISPTATYDYSTYWPAPKPARVSLADYKANLENMVDLITASGKAVTLITPWAFWSTPHLQQYPFYVDAMKEVGKEKGVPVLDAYAIQLNAWWASQPWLQASTGAPSMWSLQQDYQHPSAAGHTKIAQLCQKLENANACACRP